MSSRLIPYLENIECNNLSNSDANLIKHLYRIYVDDDGIFNWVEGIVEYPEYGGISSITIEDAVKEIINQLKEP